VPAVRLTLSASDEPGLEEVLAGLFVSWSLGPAGVSLWVPEGGADEVVERLTSAGVTVLGQVVEPERDWLAEAAALQRALAIGPIVLDPHDPPSADPGSRCRVFLPAERAFGTGSHESTRLALRLLLSAIPTGGSVLDVGCGAGTLALAARLAGARRGLGFDIDLEAPLAARLNARRNGVTGCSFWGGGLSCVSVAARFDLVVANMLQEEVAPLLPSLAALVAQGGVFVTAGQLVARQEEFLGLLDASGFEPRDLASEGEWLGTRSVRR
jgi:ribosomal protein L11 methyltransferase